MEEQSLKQANQNLIFDVGMHRGEDTDFYLKKGFQVVSFEANPDLVEHCSKRFESEIRDGRLIIVSGAIVESSTIAEGKSSVKFFRNKDKTVWGTVAEDWASRNEELGAGSEIIEVPTVDFTDCLKKYGIPHYLKIDIEGMDTVCLRAFLNSPGKPNYISIESEKIDFSALLEEFQIFEKLGYQSFKAVQQQGMSKQKVPQDTQEGDFVEHSFIEGSSGLFGSDLAGKWSTRKQILGQYKLIFFLYRYFGDDAVIKKTPLMKVLRKICAKTLRRPIPGWYDTHAKL